MAQHFTVSWFGSCRIYEPLVYLSGLKTITLPEIAGKWYTHTTKEVRQKYAITSGAVVCDLPLLRHLTADQLNAETQWQQFQSPQLQSFVQASDVAVVEVASLKLVRLKSTHPDIQYGQLGMYNEVKAGRFPAEGFPGLVHATIEKQDAGQLTQDLESLCHVFSGKKLILVGFAELGENDVVDAPRRVINETLAAFSAQHGIPFFNPTPMVQAYGREVAMLNTTHYQPAFFGIVGAHLYQLIDPGQRAQFVWHYCHLHYALKQRKAEWVAAHRDPMIAACPPEWIPKMRRLLEKLDAA